MDASVVVFFGSILGGVVVGLLVGRWWVLLAAFLIPVAYIPAGTNEDAFPKWEIALFVFTPGALLALAVGVGVRRVVDRVHGRSESSTMRR